MTATEVDGWDGEWVEGPPPPVRRQGTWVLRLEPLRERPREWAKFGPFGFHTTKRQVNKISRGVYGEGFTAERHAEGRDDWIYVKFEEEA